MMQEQFVPFGEWLPDLPQHENPGALEARNVVPLAKSYGPLRGLVAYSNALTNPCLGTFWLQDASNVVLNFCGDINNLYRLDSGVTWTDVSRTVGGNYAADNWEFTKFGDRVIAVNEADDPQYYDVGSSSNFALLPGSPPPAKTVATVRDFVMLGDIPSRGPNFIQWSGYNNSEAWTPSLSTQADFQELFGRAGKVQRIVPGEYATIFCEHSIYRADYVGPPRVFQIDEVERKRGTPSQNSVAWTGGLVFYFGWDGFYVFDGQQSKPISHNRVSKWFKDNCPASVWGDIRATIDRLNRLVIWAFKTSQAEPINNRLLIYNWAANRWAYAVLETQVLDEYVSPGFSLDALDGPLPGGIDTDSILVDSDQFAGGTINVQAFDSSNQGATFDGQPLTALIDTKEVSAQDNQRMFASSVRPMVEGEGGSTITVQVGKRNRLQDNVNFTVARGVNGINGEVNIRENSRYQRYRTNIAGGFLHANGVKVRASMTGGRR